MAEPDVKATQYCLFVTTSATFSIPFFIYEELPKLMLQSILPKIFFVQGLAWPQFPNYN